MSSLKDRIAPLESDLKAVPPRISVYHDLPFAIMRYDPTDEWELRREIKLLATRLEAVGKEVREAIERENKKLVSRLKYANLRQSAVVEDADMKASRGLDKALFAKLVAGDWITRHPSPSSEKPGSAKVGLPDCLRARPQQSDPSLRQNSHR
jgi:hypothetical protein